MSPAAGPSPVTWPVVQIIVPVVATIRPDTVATVVARAEAAGDRPHADRRDHACQHRRDARRIEGPEAEQIAHVEQRKVERAL